MLLTESQLPAQKQYPWHLSLSQELDVLNDDSNKDQKQRLEEPCGRAVLSIFTRKRVQVCGWEVMV